MKQLLALLFAVAFSSNSYAESSESILFCDEPFPPYTRLGSDGNIKGPSIDFLKEVFRRLDIPLKTKIYPWKRVVTQLAAGACDGVNFLHESDERRQFALYTAAIHESEDQCVWSVSNTEKFPKARVSNFEWKDFDDFATINKSGAKEHYLMGRVRGYIYSGGFTEAVEKGKIKTYTVARSEKEVHLLTTGRVDLVTSSRRAFAGKIETVNARTGMDISLEDFHCSEKTWPTPSYFMVISKKSQWLEKRPGLINELNAVIADIKRQGTHTVQARLLEQVED